MKYLPLFFDMTNKPCLIVGGGVVATRRAWTIQRAGAVIDLVSLDVGDDIANIVQKSGGQTTQRAWQPSDIHHKYHFILAATDDLAVNAEIADLARGLGVLVNVVSDASLCDFTFPTIIERDPIVVGISSGGASPILARLLGERIDALIPAGYGKLGALVSRYRTKVRAMIAKPLHRKLFWEKALMGNVAEAIFSGNQDDAEALLNNQLTLPIETLDCGEVYLIGAGPGDPDLLTFRAFRLLQRAEVVLYDRLVSQKILDQINSSAEMVYVGKQRADHAVPQQSINQLLVDYALAGKRVARLKGGDPFIFGRGGEEIELLAANSVPFQVVPGITAASGCASYAGIPLTHRDHAQSVRFVTGQLQDGTVALPWNELIAPRQTLVIYMGLNGLPLISKNLVAHGLSGETPAALIEQGTTLNQKVHCSTLAQLPAIVEELDIKPPTLLIIGSVVTLHHSLKWFQQS